MKPEGAEAPSAVGASTAFEDRPMPLIEHILELRRRLILALAWIAAGTVAAYQFADAIIAKLARPVGTLVFIAPAEAFLVRVKIAVFGGFLLALPAVLYQAWLFAAKAFAPGLRKYLKRAIPVSYVLFLVGSSLALFLVIPAAMKFFLSYETAQLKPLIGVGAYLHFASLMILAFGTVFQLPLILIALNRLGIVGKAQLKAQRRLVYFLGFVLGAVLTPDVFSQTVLAFSAIVLFEGALLAMPDGPALS